MAVIGQQLPQPQGGWKRCNAIYPSIQYLGQWTRFDSNNSSYQFTDDVGMQSLVSGDSFTFKFTGTKLLIKCYGFIDTSGFSLTVDEINLGNFTTVYNTVSTVVVFEKTDFSDGTHTVEIKVLDKSVFNDSIKTRVLFDAIDIDSIGYLYPPATPPTTGKLCNTLDEMDIGDYIAWKRDGSVHSFGGSIDGYTEIPVTGVASSSLPTKHFHYAIKVDTGLLISDRVTEHTISWDTLNSQKRIQGLPVTISGVSGIIRSLTGGVAYADENGNKSMNALGSEGCFPINNEWDKYVNNFPLNMVQTGKILDDVWHYSNIYTWNQDTPINGRYISSVATTSGIVNNTHRVIRGFQNMWSGFSFSISSNSLGDMGGFRPVFEWREV